MNKYGIAILDFPNEKIHLYDAKFLEENFYNIDWKKEKYSEVTDLESFITNVLGFSSEQIQWSQFKEIQKNGATK